MKYFSMFSGIGGFELGIQRAYDNQSPHGGSQGESSESGENLRQVRQRKIVQKVSRGPRGERTTDSPLLVHAGRGSAPLCVGYSEIDQYAIKVYERKFNGHTNYGDATNINPEQLPDFDLLVGGFPCQAFSIAGKRAGFEDTRGTLFFDVARILKHKRPRHFVLENVKGLLSHDSGKTFQTILKVLSDLGYGVEWQILNSKNFGVPQNRERIYIVGHLGNRCGRKIFPLTRNDEENLEPVEGRGAEVFPTIRATHYKSGDNQPVIATGIDLSTQESKITEQARALQARYHKGYSHRKAETTGIIQLNNPKHSNDRVYAETGLGPTLNTMQGGRRQPFVAPVLTPDRPTKRQNGRRFKENGDPSFTLTAQDRHGIYDGVKIRRLTPRECERLQGFPDDWTIEESDTQRYKMCGNAVTVNVVEAVIGALV